MDNTKNLKEREEREEYLEDNLLEDWKKDYEIMDSDYRFEEDDDPRTSDGSLVPDFAKEITAKDYYRCLNNVIDSCGKVSYYFRMYKNVLRGDNRAKEFADKNGLNADYFKKHYEAWRFETLRALAIFKLTANHFGIRLTKEDEDFLNSLVEKDRRDSYRISVKTAQAHDEIISLEDLEEKYKKRIEKRAQKKAF